MTVPAEPEAILSPRSEIPPAASPLSAPLHHVTPLLFSPSLSARTGHNIYLKLDIDQPSGSFKLRGVGAICQSALAASGDTHLVSSSGGNAGLAVAYAASRAGVGCTIFVPASTETDVVERLRKEGARVVIGGDAWDVADAAAREEVRETGGTYVHPFEGEVLVNGHSSVVDEIYDQMPEGERVDVLVSSVGGGGLLRGIIQGVTRQGGKKPVLVGVQNFGVDSFNRSLDQWSACGEEGVVTLERIESKCTSMGTKKCSAATLRDAIEFQKDGGRLVSLTVTDELSASACWQFAEEKLPDGRKRMVELSCASALTTVYHPWVLERVLDGLEGEKGRKLNVVIEVCGGSKVNQAMLKEYKEKNGKMEGRDRIRVNGVDFPASSA
ncbi:Tryptophan synthase beta subunit-like PLP-dependent enzymes superfamily [Kalmanozyma brasiliensis GHG001]|uniref:L-serine ammonia-lyase n=1 Tax=Kalmanozyma brasiliensis (strain GHG001) TaxID=1365824 RepID=V5ERA7_KALBG|nr:Tryptophan synthase beta subunit-like PLP-dependent enzymes superfamily [Kalmanozyma brasiliensis GHG001]EST07655.1 Tryptophan synthase beta subunit-like PLP-dependent enzymes superfamily [Kalmanozyma brasiliensis GHG001]